MGLQERMGGGEKMVPVAYESLLMLLQREAECAQRRD